MRRALWAVPVVAFLATFGVFGVRHPGSVRAMLMNPSGLAMTAAAIVAAGIFVWASQFRPKIQPFVPLVIAAGILGAAVYAEVPFERTSTQNKTLVTEDIVAGPSPTATLPPPLTSTSTLASPSTTTSTTQGRVSPPPTAMQHASGSLQGINHSASGTVSAIESSTGQWVIRFTDFTVQGSPAPVLYVVDERDAEDPGGTDLGAFTATNGDLLDVALPSGVRPGAGWTVLIWCDKFDTPIANATLG